MIPDERADLLQALAQLAKRQDAEGVDPLSTFLPLWMHRPVLGTNVVVVLGGRGAGKTALFKLVNDPRTASKLKAFFEDDRLPELPGSTPFPAGARSTRRLERSPRTRRRPRTSPSGPSG